MTDDSDDRIASMILRLKDALTEAMASYTHARRLAGLGLDLASIARWREALGHRDTQFVFGDHVTKVTGDYTFDGEVRGIVYKTRGEVRYVVEDERGLLLILNASQLQIKLKEPP